jgi:hypothetical protein
MSRMWRFGMALLALALPPAAFAQELSLLLPGTPVRVVGHGGTLRAYFHSAAGDTLYVSALTGMEPVAISHDRIRAVRVAERRSRAGGAWLGAAWGGAIGGATMAVDCMVDVDACRAYWEIRPDRGAAGTVVGATVQGAMGGAMIGAIIGAIWPGEREREVWLLRRASVTVQPSGTGLALSVPAGSAPGGRPRAAPE